MAGKDLAGLFTEAAQRVGAQVVSLSSPQAATDYIREHSQGAIALPSSPTLERLGLAGALRQEGCEVAENDLRAVAPRAFAGVSGANFAIADTGTVVLESTAEATRLATTLPQIHFVLLDRAKIVEDGLAAVPHVRRFHRDSPRNFLAYISGPSRTADIERVLTIGVHGPRELHILLMDGISGDVLEN